VIFKTFLARQIVKNTSFEDIFNIVFSEMFKNTFTLSGTTFYLDIKNGYVQKGFEKGARKLRLKLQLNRIIFFVLNVKILLKYLF
jgi:hypothetical protein